eukprot:CAMPEP_0170627338 /NCGR_PEP_ID=MMETSP0224-20130122/31919_1 /TAXON_ID=285029 /ORGANISM="Togula jolla, Strain CCCM 725" /LENGTH=232 /DNA_ID=CAMNT_0010954333 /DNA_START=21 /DNA_END=717 /DNA_ORIENTATION=+
MSKTGVVNTWVEERGYGFISPTDDKVGDLFVHVDNIKDRNIKQLKRGDRVRFDVEMNTNPTKNAGKRLAINVVMASGRSGGQDADRSRDRDRDRDREETEIVVAEMHMMCMIGAMAGMPQMFQPVMDGMVAATSGVAVTSGPIATIAVVAMTVVATTVAATTVAAMTMAEGMIGMAGMTVAVVTKAAAVMAVLDVTTGGTATGTVPRAMTGAMPGTRAGLGAVPTESVASDE